MKRRGFWKSLLGAGCVLSGCKLSNSGEKISSDDVYECEILGCGDSEKLKRLSMDEYVVNQVLNESWSFLPQKLHERGLLFRKRLKIKITAFDE